MSDENNLVGKQLGNYRLIKAVNSGAYGNIYQGKHIIFDEEPVVAIKVLHAHLNSQEERSKFIQEAQLLKKLQHPYILPIIDAGIHEGIPYLVTAFASGDSLRNRLKKQPNQPLPLQDALNILSQVGQALYYAHQNKIVHRDLKPGNILFNAQNEALLADFGIAAVLATSGTKQLGRGGTPAYMAPEQFDGIVSTKSDQYALGCLAYEIMTGRRPFNVENTSIEAIWYQHARVEPTPPGKLNSKLPAHIARAIMKAMAKDRADRFESVSDFIAALMEVKEDEDLPAFPVRPRSSFSFEPDLGEDIPLIDEEDFAALSDEELPPPSIRLRPSSPPAPRGWIPPRSSSNSTSRRGLQPPSSNPSSRRGLQPPSPSNSTSRRGLQPPSSNPPSRRGLQPPSSNPVPRRGLQPRPPSTPEPDWDEDLPVPSVRPRSSSPPVSRRGLQPRPPLSPEPDWDEDLLDPDILYEDDPPASSVRPRSFSTPLPRRGILQGSSSSPEPDWDEDLPLEYEEDFPAPSIRPRSPTARRIAPSYIPPNRTTNSMRYIAYGSLAIITLLIIIFILTHHP